MQALKLELHLCVFVSDLAGYKPDQISEGLCMTGVMANGAPFLGRIQQGPSTPLPLPGSCISGACKITSWMMRQTLPQTDKAGSRSACSLQVWLIDSSLNRQPEGIFFFKAINRKRMCGEGAPTFKRPSLPPSPVPAKQRAWPGHRKGKSHCHAESKFLKRRCSSSPRGH